MAVSFVRISVVIRGRPRVLTGMLRQGVMVPYHEDPGFTTEIIGLHTVYAGSATIADRCVNKAEENPCRDA